MNTRLRVFAVFAVSFSLLARCQCHEGNVKGLSAFLQVSGGDIDFGRVPVRSHAEEPLDVENLGDLGISFEVKLAGGTTSEFSCDKTGLLDLDPGERIDLVLSYAPDAEGKDSGALLIVSEKPAGEIRVALRGEGIAPAIWAEPPALDFGDVVILKTEVKSVEISNRGERPLTVSGIETAGDEAGVFKITSQHAFPIILDPAEPPRSFTVTVSYKPLEIGENEAFLRFATDVPGEERYDVGLRGKGVAPKIEFDPPSIDFGTVNRMETSSKNLTVKNTGNITLNVFSITVPEGSEPDEFGIEGVESFPFEVEAGRSISLTVSYTPADGLPDSGYLVFTCDDPLNRNAKVTLSGRVPSPDVSVGDVSVELVGELASKDFDVYISNRGEDTLTVSDLGLGLPGNPAEPCPEFTLNAGRNPAIPFEVEAGAQQAISVKFQPPQAGSYSCRIKVTSDDPDEPEVTARLTGVKMD